MGRGEAATCEPPIDELTSRSCERRFRQRENMAMVGDCRRAYKRSRDGGVERRDKQARSGGR